MAASSLISDAFQANFDQGKELGASLSVWKKGKELLSLHRGFVDAQRTKAWTKQSLIPIFSATKGPASAALLLALYRADIPSDTAIGELWSQFPAPKLPISALLAHQAGLAALARPASIFDHADCVAAIEESSPYFAPPQHGYHPQTFGPMLDELMIRITGERLGLWWEREIRQILGIDFYIGTPKSEFPRIATLIPSKSSAEAMETPFYKEFFNKNSRINHAFSAIRGLDAIRLMNTPAAWTCASPALGGIASAAGLAQFYQELLFNRTLFPQSILDALSTPITDGADLTLLTPTSFSQGMMVNPRGSHQPLYGKNGFGHSGAGGSHAFAEPSQKLSFAYTMNQMELSVLPPEKTCALIQALLESIEMHTQI